MMNLLFVFTILCIAAENVYASSNHNKDYNVGVLNMGKQSRNKIQNQAESRRNHTGVSSHRKIRDLSRVMITQHFNEKIVAPGDDVQLQCIASSDKPPRFIWDRDGVTISANTDARYTITQMITSSGIKVVSSLNISRVRVEDGGIYSCKAIEAGAEDSHEARLDVYGPPYIRALPPIKVQSGQTLKLRCPYYGYPLSKQEWEHKGKKVQSISLPHHTRFRRSNRRKRQIYEPNENGALLVTKITKEMNGESYTCIVYSPSGEMARRSFEIQVVEAPELDELRVGTGLKEGQIVQITCNIISGDPPIYFSWLKDGKKIPTALKVTERSSELFSVLIIKKVSLEHCGKYSCIATNHVGKTNQTAELFVNVAPKWLEEPKNTSLLLGQRGGVYCNANGYPAPQINWMKKDETLGIWRPVLDLAGGGVMSLANGTLIIEQVSLADEGMYSCHAENNIGNALNKNLWISVNKPVHFESRSLNLTTKIGQTSSFKCQPMGDRPLHVRWLHNGVLLDRSSARLTISESASQNGLTSVVSINHVETRDGGVYECRASNQFGISSFYINLSILEPPTPPLDLQIDSISSRSAKISWRDTIKDHVQFYSVQHTANEFLWDMAFVDNVTRQVSELRQKTELRDLLPATDYRVRVASGNQVDISHYTQPLHFTTQQEAPSSPPLSVQVQVTDSPGEVSVRWLPPPVELSHGVLQGYHVKAVPTVLGPDVDESQTKTVKVVSRLGKHETILSGLLKNTRYEISVSAFNSAGNGPYSTPVSQITREGAPEIAPSGIECRSATSSSLRISWQPIIVHSSSLMGYSVYYSTDDGPWQNISSIHTEIYLQSLLKFTNYSIKIAGYSSYGIGPFSQPITCATLQDVPGPPAAIKVVLASSSSLLATWKKPDFPNGIITHYTVYVKPTSSTSPSQTYKVEPTELDFPSKNMGFEIRNLVEGRQYEVYVSASTRAGEGRPTASVIKEVSDRVVAGVSSLGGLIVGVSGSSVLLVCSTVGSPPPRTVWYKSHDIIVNHPRYTRNHDDSLLINNIDQSLSGNYTCLAKNLYGSDSVSYVVVVQPTPDPPRVRVTPHRNGLHLAWDEPKGGKKMIYTISWKEINEAWQETWTTKSVTLQGVHDYSVEGLKCGTKYSLRLTAANNVGVSTPAFFEASTLGGYPIAPTSTEWFWSNATHILVQTSGWDENSCPIIGWDIDYRRYGSKEWHKVEKIAQFTQQWINPSTQIGTISIADLNPAQWYQIKVVATNSAGDAVSYYNYATTTISGETIGPPSDALDLNMLVIIFSSVLLAICLLLCIYIIVKRQYSEEPFNEYRNSLTAESKSERSNVTVNTPQSVNEANRVYSTPIHLASDAKHELYEISPYAQFAIGFRTFGHVDNQEAPRLPGSSKGRYDSETSFQLRSESEESDCVSRSTTLKGLPKKSCRIPHHNR